MTVVTFEDYEPTPRTDGLPWTGARIEEAPTKVGDWTLIDTISFSGDLDADPRHPKARDFVTENATLDQGWYRVTFIDANGDHLQPTAPVQNVSLVGLSYVPGVNDIGEAMASRTRDKNGNLLLTFTKETTPTDDQVRGLIRKAVADVQADVGHDVPDNQADYVRNLIVWRTVMLIELSYFPEQIGSDRSSYGRVNDLYKDQLAKVLTSLEAAEGGDTGTPSTGFAAFGGFPVADSLMTREF